MIDEVITEAPKQVFYIKLTSEADMPTALAFAYKQDSYEVTDEETGETSVVLDGDPYLVAYTRDYSIDVIGVMHEPTGTMLTDAEGNELAAPAALTVGMVDKVDAEQSNDLAAVNKQGGGRYG